MATFGFEVETVGTFYSVGDENSFFQWVYGLNGYKTCTGSGQSVQIDFELDDMDRGTLSELVAVFRRYNIADFSSLRALVNAPDGAWFASPQMYWHELVFLDRT
ncbi:hypothetical protein [Acidisphaera sp. L21]|uniref:hypothetical protein n=1 Tax=Acidisphaera sp. L21 TaxID=1641851 RepID=UPI00131AAF1A|nr:hypothetical protein [Acidisphaera sp. L21]